MRVRVRFPVPERRLLEFAPSLTDKIPQRSDAPAVMAVVGAVMQKMGTGPNQQAERGHQ